MLLHYTCTSHNFNYKKIVSDLKINIGSFKSLLCGDLSTCIIVMLGQVTYRVVPIGPNDDGHSQVVGGSRPYIVSSQVSI